MPLENYELDGAAIRILDVQTFSMPSRASLSPSHVNISSDAEPAKFVGSLSICRVKVSFEALQAA